MPCVVNMEFLPQCCTIIKFHLLGHWLINIFWYATFLCHSRRHADKMTNTWSTTHHSVWQSGCLLFRFSFFLVVTTVIMFPLTEGWKNWTATSWNRGSLAVKWQHLVCTWVQSPTSGVWWQEIESRWMSAVLFVLFCSPQVFHYTAATRAVGLFDMVDVVNLCVEKPLNGHTIVIHKKVNKTLYEVDSYCIVYQFIYS